MNRVWRLGALLAFPASLAAQDEQKSCDVEEGKPQKVALAAFNLQRAFNMAKPEEKAKTLRDVVKAVTEPDKKNENPIGKAYILGKAMIVFASEPALITGKTRGDLGWAVSPTASADLLAIADSAFRVVEQANPGCASEISQWRHQAPWFQLVQESFNALQSSQWDSAATLARRAMVINRTSAYGPYVLATVAANAQNSAEAKANYKKAIELAGDDTSYAEIRRRSTFEIGRLSADAAENTTVDADKKALAREAIVAFKSYLSEAPTASDAPAVRNTLVDLYMTVGDSASIPEIYADLIANPTRYDDIALVQAGVIPTRLNRTPDAAKLFEAALTVNPHQRDAMSNLAAMYFAMNEFTRMIPIVDKLVKADPNNPDNWLLYAFAYQGLQRAAKDARLKKAYADSLIKYNKMSEDMPMKVTFSGFSRGDKETILTGAIENRAKTQQTYTMNFEFLGKDGTVQATETVTVGPVAPNSTGTFNLKVAKGGLVAFRYAPLK